MTRATQPAKSNEPRVARPRWVKLFLLITAVIVVSLVILLLVGGHGPGDHRGVRLPMRSSGTVSGASTR